jgi:hypothetical protein
MLTLLALSVKKEKFPGFRYTEGAMRIYHRCFVFFCLVLLLSLPILRAGAQNYVQNGSFEQGLAHWSGSACSLDAKQRHWEESSVRLGSGGRLTQTVSGLTAGQTYYAAVWCQGENAGARTEVTAGIHRLFRAALPTGTYGWTRVQFRFVAEARYLPIIIRVAGKTSALKTAALWVGDVYVTRDPCVNVRTLGLLGDGKTDVTTALGAALAAKRFLYLPAGIYCLSGTVTVPQGAILWGDGMATVLKKQDPRAGAMLTATGTDTNSSGHDEITGLRFVGLPGQDEHIEQHALSFVKVNSLLVRHCSTRDCGLLITETNKKAYREVVSKANLSKNVRVVFNNIEGGVQKHLSPSTGIELRYTTDAAVSHNAIRNFAHGILWWGGNSDFSTDGAMKNPRWARRIVIADNRVENVGGGGIWGSMGQNVVVNGNTIKDCGDVGLDFEGCFDSVADSNFVIGAHNGGLSSFFGASNLTFSRNIVATNNPEWPVFRLYNSSVDPANVRNVTLKDNVFHAAIGIGVFDDHNGPGPLTITGNKFINVRIDISHRGTGMNVVGPVITGNILTFNTELPAAWAAIHVLYLFGDTTVSRNTIRYYRAVQSNMIGIQVQKEPGQTSKTVIEGNKVAGFGQADIQVSGKAPGSSAAIDSNIAEDGVIAIGDASVLTVTGSGNKDSAGAAVNFTRLP